MYIYIYIIKVPTYVYIYNYRLCKISSVCKRYVVSHQLPSAPPATETSNPTSPPLAALVQDWGDVYGIAVVNSMLIVVNDG